MLSETTQRKISQAQSGTARAALLGVSDGLVTNVSLILGVAAASASADVVRVAGLASLIAGACSMAVGEYISMRGQIELLESVLSEEREELRKDPDRVKSELREIMENDGIHADSAKQAANDVAKHPEKAMAVYARGKLGVNPDELGSAWGSAISSFVMFALGASVPLIPWYLGAGTVTVFTSLALSMIAALLIGAYLGSITSGRWIWTALRQLLILIIAAGITYVVGLLFHTSLA